MKNGEIAQKFQEAATILDPASGLSVQEEQFAKNIAGGMSNYESCRHAGYQGGKQALSVKGSQIMRFPHVAKRIDELRAGAQDGRKTDRHAQLEQRDQAIQEALISSGICTLESHLAQLAIIRDGAIIDHKWRDATEAEVKRGEAIGLYDRRATGVTDLTDRLAKLDGDASQVALKIALAKLHEHSSSIDDLKAKAAGDHAIDVISDETRRS